MAELANGQKWLGREGRDNVPNVGGQWESRDGKFSIMCGLHDGAIQILNADGIDGQCFVVDRGVDGEEVGCAASVGDGQGGSDGRMTCSI